MGKIAKTAVKYAVSKIGCSYSQPQRWNKNPDKFDCSSLIWRAYKEAGYTFKSGSTSDTEVYDTEFALLWPESRKVLGKSYTSIEALKRGGYKPEPGDVIYINTISDTNRANKITHVVMYEDSEQFVQARGRDFGVCRTNDDIYGGKIIAVTRFKEEPDIETPKPKIVNAICSGNTVNVRTGMNTSSEIVATLSKGHPMVVLDKKEQWSKIITILNDGKEIKGYMSSVYIDIIKYNI